MNESYGKGPGNDRLERELGRLPQGVQPERDLWPQIIGRLGVHEYAYEPPKGKVPRLSGWGQLAAALALVIASSLVTVVVMRERLERETAATVPAMTPASTAAVLTTEAMPASFGGAQLMGEAYFEARAELVRTFEARLTRLSPAQREKVQRNLADIQRAAAELSATLAEHPGSALLQELLLSTYQDELALLADVNDVTGSALPRNDL